GLFGLQRRIAAPQRAALVGRAFEDLAVLRLGDAGELAQAERSDGIRPGAEVLPIDVADAARREELANARRADRPVVAAAEADVGHGRIFRLELVRADPLVEVVVLRIAEAAGDRERLGERAVLDDRKAD